MLFREFKEVKQHTLCYANMSIEFDNLPENQTLVIVKILGGMFVHGKIEMKSHITTTCITDTCSAYEVYELHQDKCSDLVQNWIK